MPTLCMCVCIGKYNGSSISRGYLLLDNLHALSLPHYIGTIEFCLIFCVLF